MRREQPTCGSRLAAAAILGLTLLTPAAILAGDDASDLEELGSWMTGTFSSAVQAAEDPDFFDIILHMATIWPDREDGHWLYVEQAVREYQDRPYRQRVYRLREIAPGLFESQVFTLPEPGTAVGAWISEEPLADLDPDDLEERDGCAILLRRRGETFEGSTLATLCSSSLRGAAYATSEVVVTAEGMVSWDRGFAADGSQVWGATKGGYVFDRIIPDDPASEFESESEPASASASDPDPDPVPDLVPDSEAEGRDGVTPASDSATP